jgi:hypothetical protein
MDDLCSWSNNKKPCRELFTYWRDDLNRYLCEKHYRKAKSLEKTFDILTRKTLNILTDQTKCDPS